MTYLCVKRGAGLRFPFASVTSWPTDDEGVCIAYRSHLSTPAVHVGLRKSLHRDRTVAAVLAVNHAYSLSGQSKGNHTSSAWIRYSIPSLLRPDGGAEARGPAGTNQLVVI